MKHLIVYLLGGLYALSIQSCQVKNAALPLVAEKGFEQTTDNHPIHLFTLKNKNGMVSQITNLGGRVVSLWTPDRNGQYEDIVLGMETANDYLTAKEKYFGALIGRYGNRIANGTFVLNDDTIKLAQNNGSNHLHGGINGFNNVVWKANLINEQTLELEYHSPDMEEGYPGKLSVKVVYQLTDANELKIEYRASTDRPTPVNLTHHSFFNLRGAGNGSINNHLLFINADYYTPIDENLIPTGEIASVKGTPMDFTQATAIGSRVNSDDEQLIFGRGYDHNWVLNPGPRKVNLAARTSEPQSGRIMEVYTNEPGIQFYGGNFLDGSDIGKGDKAYTFRSAFCLETQHFPDSPNQKAFPSTILQPGENYYSICIYRFAFKR